jgi:hypothetical protein
MPNDVCISYSRQDGDFAERLARILHLQGISAISDRQIQHGENWESAFRGALDNAEAVVLVMSPDALNSPYVMVEVGAALASHKPIIAVLPPNRRLPRDVPQPIGELRLLRADKLSDSEIATSLHDSFEHLACEAKAR